ncbi:MAG: ABC transporter permease [Trueperaceae bacterium]
MILYIIRRFFHLIPTFLGGTLLAFLVTQLVPGDYFTTMAINSGAKPETIERMREQFGLDDPMLVQYLRWMGNLLQGNLGYSFDSNQPVTNLLTRPIYNSMILVVFSLVILYALAIPLGVYAATRQYSFGDQIISIIGYFALAIPNFFAALLLISLLFTLRRWTSNTFGFDELILPVAKMTSNHYNTLSVWGKFWDIMWHALLPSFVVALSGIAGLTRVLRAQMIEFLQSDFIRTAKSKGLSEHTVVYKHALRSAIIPFVAGIGGLLPGLIGGAGLVEVVLAWPGITSVFLNSIGRQDIYVVLGFLVISSLLLMIGNLLSDLLLALADPRIRYT